jgi:pimeloyl-ACP methyl ester carboxylesterase
MTVYDVGTGFPIFYYHGTPNLGAPPEPLFADGIRWIGYDRAGYGDAPAEPGRDVASAARHTERIADDKGIERFAVLGHSGGGPHALACAALLGDRVTAAVSISGLAPYGAPGLDWFAGMASPAALRAAARGLAAKQAYEAAPTEDDPGFIPADWAALEGEWGWFGTVVAPAMAAGPGAAIDDDLAYVNAWGFDPASIAVPVLLVHGGRDASVPAAHSVWLAGHVPGAELRISPDEGHISILIGAARPAVQWLLRQR